MFGTGRGLRALRRFRLHVAALLLLPGGVSALEDQPVLFILYFAVLPVGALCLGWCLCQLCWELASRRPQLTGDPTDSCAQHSMQTTVEMASLQPLQPFFQKASQRIADWTQVETMAACVPSLPAGRYVGYRQVYWTSVRESVEYKLSYHTNGLVEGTVAHDGAQANVQLGWYNSKKGEFQWVETNVQLTSGSDYFSQAKELLMVLKASMENVPQPSPGVAILNDKDRLAEVSVKVIDPDQAKLKGEFVAFSGARGVISLEFDPMPTEGNQTWVLEPTLEKESL